ncbi:MAG: sugar ABC transporter permease, partial [Lachnospiraceae bacterium]|nr:sugar ABC transporter permease [Lachnospiraceae bacterium]
MEKNQKNHAAPAAVASAFIWGSGQWMNRQYAKGALFFLAQIVFLILLPTILENINGLITLGDTAMVVNGSKVTQGDNSILLMLFGLLFVFVAALFLFIYVFNIRDAYSQGKRIAEGRLVYTGKTWGKHMKDSSFPYLVLTPAIILVGLFVVIPIIFSFLIAFTNYSSPDHLPPKNLVDWVGFKNFAMLVNMPTWNSTLLGVAAWTVVWAVGSTFSCFFGGLLVACLIESKRVRLKKFWRTLYILPWAIPGMISLLVFRNMFNGQFGAINTFLRNQGIISANIPWLSDPIFAKVVIFVVNFWLGFPYFMALMSGIMTSIDTEVLDAAKVDGANERQVFRHVTLPIVMY